MGLGLAANQATSASLLFNGGTAESAIMDAGYSHYVSGQGERMAVVVGEASHALTARPVATARNGALDAALAKASRGLVSEELNAIEPSRIPDAKLRIGTLAMPMDSCDATNHEMARIGSGLRFSPVREADASAAQYAAVAERLKGTAGWLKAANRQ